MDPALNPLNSQIDRAQLGEARARQFPGWRQAFNAALANVRLDPVIKGLGDRGAGGIIYVAACLALASTARADEPQKPQPDFAFVASGGVSLGSYQAGVSYVFLKDLLNRQDKGPSPTLSVVTGASAGNINVFLAALTWFDADRKIGPFENLFWDTWINIGWEKLSPEDPEAGGYCDGFEKVQTSPFRKFPTKVCASRKTRPGHCAGAKKGDSIYTAADGLLTRAAYCAAEDNLYNVIQSREFVRRSDDPGVRGSPLRVGITLTRSRLDTDMLQGLPVAKQRYAMPFVIQPAAELKDPQPKSLLEIRNIEDDWDKISNVGTAAYLPVEKCDGSSRQVSLDALFKAVEASSAFPLAFSPVDVPVVLDAPQNATCVAKAETRRFYDGGVFDNVPLGLAIELVQSRSDKKGEPRYFYVHPDQLRSPYEFPETSTPTRGTAYLGRVGGHFLQEGRQYELQGIARFNRGALNIEKNGFVATSRFFPVIGEYYINAFGAFMAQSYRIHDYLVGLYDGIFAIAADKVRSNSTRRAVLPGRPADWKYDDWKDVAAAFKLLVDDTIEFPKTDTTGVDDTRRDDRFPPWYANESNTRRISTRYFLRDLFAYELRWTTNLSGSQQDQIVAVAGQGIAREELPADSCDNVVWRIHKTLREIDSKGRLLARGGSRPDIERFVQQRDSLEHVIQVASYGPAAETPVNPAAMARWFMDSRSCRDEDRHAMPDTAQGRATWFNTWWDQYRGTESFQFKTIDRLMRRAADVETEDEKQVQIERDSLPHWTFPVARLVYASASERDDRLFDPQPGTLSRLLEGHPGQVWMYALPNAIDFGHSQDLLWSLRMRPRWNGMFLGLDAGPWRITDLGTQNTRFGWRAGLGIGYDPAGRILDDAQIAATFWREQPQWFDFTRTATGRYIDSVGLEVSAVLVTKLRVAIGFPHLGGPLATGRSASDRFTDVQFSLGLTDLNGLAATTANLLLRILGHPTENGGEREVTP